MNSTAKDKNTQNRDDLKKVKDEIDKLLEETYRCTKENPNLVSGHLGWIHDRFTLHGVSIDVEKMGTQIVVALPLPTEEIACEGISCRDITTDNKGTGKKSARYGKQKSEFYVVHGDSPKLQKGTKKVPKESYISIEDDWRKIVKEIFDQVFSVTSLQPEHSTRGKLVEKGGTTGLS